MTYTVQVPDSVRNKIDSWDLTTEQTREIYERLIGELEKRPLEVLVSVVAPYRMHQYSFQLHDDTHRRTIVFAVEVQSDEATLLLLDCWNMTYVKKQVGSKTLPVT